MNHSTFQPWGGAAISDWTNAEQSIIISDMTQCTPASSLSSELSPNCWKVIPYEVIDGHKGKMVWAPPEANAPELAVPLKVKGWYAIFVGLYSVSEAPTLAWLRLSKEAAPVDRTKNDNNAQSEDIYFKAVELTEDDCLHISQQSTGFVKPCGVTHIRLIPLTEEETKTLVNERTDSKHRTMTMTFDGFSSIFYKSPRTATQWLSLIEIFRNTDAGTLILQSPGADKVIYPSKIGSMKGAHAKIYPRIGDRYFVESIKEMERQGINPWKVLIDGARDMGIKVHTGIRPAGWSIYEPFADYWEPPFYTQNPQWRCIDRDGTPVTRMSWAVPEVREHMIDILIEQVQFGADGAHIVFNRGYPLALYEPAACEIFRNNYGEDPRMIDESDPRIIKWWSDIVTTFMRELRQRLDLEQERRGDGQFLEISVNVLGNEQDNLQFGVDLRRLIDERLIDEIFTYKWDFGSKNRVYDLEFFKEICQGTTVSFSPSTSDYFASKHYTTDLVKSFYGQGAKGITIWDAVIVDMYTWMVVSRFGHAEETLWRMDNLDIHNPPRTCYLFHRLGDQVYDGRFASYWGG